MVPLVEIGQNMLSPVLQYGYILSREIGFTTASFAHRFKELFEL
ncbi:hypothetical protein Cycma_3452 [Cyclobacterium marinum DSM 745]|uniref:Uncharacterized protein n=1 Tax=Cyclobacterium marinum (strain ATCC 25205 / DSM 745 / LMG 13164 / NCIMB 1802) TaxID=880070 RepID=G0IXI3_CYCMS|nr:hypothetical protein Cycma_3452 [Cyclobacterium marinum DSM 745]